MLSTGTSDAVDLELMNELLDVDLYRRVANVIGFRCGWLRFGFFLFRFLFFVFDFFFFFFLFRLPYLHSSLRIESVNRESQSALL